MTFTRSIFFLIILPYISLYNANHLWYSKNVKKKITSFPFLDVLNLYKKFLLLLKIVYLKPSDHPQTQNKI